jgi:hypothetical protein
MDRLQLNQLLEVVCSLDIALNPAPEAIFDPLIQGFNIWCTPNDNPGGDWSKITSHMIAAAYTKPCEYVACTFAKWDEEVRHITHFSLSTDAYALQDRLPNEYTAYKRLIAKGYQSICNRGDDVAWAKKKIEWVFAKARLDCPRIIVEED